MLDIIIPSYNCAEKLAAAVESVRVGTKRGWKMFVIDNASEDGAREWLMEQGDLCTTFNDTNEGFSRATNQGIRLSMRNPCSEWTVLMNNDILVPDAWDLTMLNVLAKCPKVKICSPLLLKPRGRHTPRDQIKRAHSEWGPNRMKDVDWLGLSCAFVHKKVWQRYGLLRDDRRYWHWGSDADLCRRLLVRGQDGWRVCYYTGLGVMHFHSAARKYLADKRRKQGQ